MNDNMSDQTARKLVWRARMRKSMTGMHAALSLLLLLLLVVMVNYLSFRHYLREDWSAQRLTELSEQTQGILSRLDQPLRIVVFTGMEHRVRDPLEDLLAEMDRRSSMIKLEYVDPDRDLGRSTDLQRTFHVTQADQVILAGEGRHVVVDMDDMVLWEPEDERPIGQAPRMIGFRGEPLLTAALLRLTGEQMPVVYFLTGHGEKNIDGFQDDLTSYSNVRERLESENVDVRALPLEATGGIPDDAGAVVIAGPTTRLPQPELDILRDYLNRGGRMLVLLNPAADGGLAPLLYEWGIQLVDDMVIDQGATLTGAEVYISRFADHPVSRGLDGITVPFLRPRSVRPVAGTRDGIADRPRYTALAASSNQSFAKQDLQNPVMRYQPGVDAPGPIPIAAAIEKGQPGMDWPNTRLVVLGDADFAANRLQSGAGLTLIQHSLNWLLDREDLIAMPPRPLEEIRLQVDSRGLNQLLLMIVVIMPGSVALLGFLVGWRRRT